jgi:hypothetical protein
MTFSLVRFPLLAGKLADGGRGIPAFFNHGVAPAPLRAALRKGLAVLPDYSFMAAGRSFPGGPNRIEAHGTRRDAATTNEGRGPVRPRPRACPRDPSVSRLSETAKGLAGKRFIPSEIMLPERQIHV